MDDVEEDFKDELRDVFQEAIFFNNLETELAIFEALIGEVHFFADRCKEDGLDPELEAIRKEEFKMAYEQYDNYKDVIRPLLKEYMEKVKDTGRPIHIGYYKILRELGE